jgi:hypothetical protein
VQYLRLATPNPDEFVVAVPDAYPRPPETFAFVVELPNVEIEVWSLPEL